MALQVRPEGMARTKKTKKRSAGAKTSPGGPGGMASLRRAQAKLKELGIKPYKPSK